MTGLNYSGDRAADIPALDLPRLQPISDDLLAVVALQQVELDALRLQVGMTPYGQRRQFTADDLRRGHSLGPTAMFLDPDKLVVRLDW